MRKNWVLPTGRSSRGRAANKPLRTITEMAEEFVVERRVLASLLGHRGGPRPVMRVGTTQSNSWYDPAAVRLWWKDIHNEDGTLRKAGERDD